MKIVLNGPVAQAGAAILRHRFGAAAEVIEVDHRTADERAISAFAEAEILVSVDFNARLPPMPKLRLVHLPAAGLDTVDLAAVPQGCRVCNVFEHDIGVSEYVMAAMLYFTIGLVSKSERFRSGSWADSPRVGASFSAGACRQDGRHDRLRPHRPRRRQTGQGLRPAGDGARAPAGTSIPRPTGSAARRAAGPARSR